MDRERLDGWCERGVLGLVMAILIYSPLATGAVRPQDFVFVEWLTVALAFVWLLRFWLNPKHRLLWPPVCWAVLAFVLYAVGRYLTAEIEFAARQELIKVLVYTVIFFAVLHNLHRQESTHILAMTLLFLGMAISFYGVYQFLADSDHVWHFLRPEQYRKRASGTFICPNNLAGYLEMLLPLGMAYTLMGRLSHVTKVFAGYVSLAIFAGLVATVSLGGWIATGVAVVLFFVLLLRHRDYRLQAALLLAGLLITIGVFSAILSANAQLSRNRLQKLEDAGKLDDWRYRLWQPAIEIWKDNFWWGAGPAHFDYRFRQYRPADEQMQARPDRVHNDYLNTLADWGLAGAVLVAACWGLFYWGVFSSWIFVQRAPNDLTTKRSNKSTFVMGGALGLAAILVHSMFDFNMHIPANAILAVTLMALVAGHFRFASERYWHTVHAPARALVTVALLALLAYLGTQSWRRTGECYWLGRARSEEEAKRYYSEARIAALARAAAIEPNNFETTYELGECYRNLSSAGAEGFQALIQKALPWYERGLKQRE